MRLSMLVPAALAALFATTLQASAEEIAVGQAGKMFNPGTVQINVGDSVKFNNDDKVTHAVLVEGPATTNLGQIKAGEAKSVTFGQAGTYDAKCAIHPKMKLISAMAGDVSRAVGEQSQSTREISQNATATASGATQLSATISDLGDASQLTGQASSRVMSATREVSEQTRLINDEITRYVREMRSA